MLHSEHYQVLRACGDLEVCAGDGRVRQLILPTSGDQPVPGSGPDDRPACGAGRSPAEAAAHPGFEGLRGWIERETRLSNPALAAEVEATGDPDLAMALEWSEAVNRSIGEIVKDVPPFPFVRESLESMQGQADVMVVSATPGEALVREWEEHGLRPLVSLIAGQEMGSKQEHLALAAAGRYEPDKILMVGDAPGDLEGGRANGVLFYPIDPGGEDESWQRFFEEALPRFFAGTYRRRLHGRAGRPVPGAAPGPAGVEMYLSARRRRPGYNISGPRESRREDGLGQPLPDAF